MKTKNFNFILFTIGVLLITILCFFGMKANANILSKKSENIELTYNENDELNNENIFENSYKRVLKIGDTIDIKDIIIDRDISTIKYISNSDETITIVDNNTITALTDGESNIIYKLDDEEIKINIIVESAKSNALSNENSAGKVYFLNTQTKSLETNEAILIEGSNGEYALIDTSNISSCSSLVKKIQYYTNTKKVTLKYVIISHYHGDHIQCFNSLLDNKNIKVKNVVLKDTMLSHSTYKSKANKAKSKKANIIKTNNINEGDYLTLGNTYLYLYNTSDVFEKNKKCNKKISIIKFKSVSKKSAINSSYLINDNNYYIINGAAESNYTYTTSKIKRKTNILPDNNNNTITYYAKKVENRESCSENANSIAVLVDFEVNKKDHRYAYLPSDIENNGYPVWGAYNSSTSSIHYGTGTSYSYELNEGVLTPESKNVHYAAESKTANAIKEKIGENNLQKITIYQQSHHGFNNAKDALETLGFDKERPVNYPLYAIATLINNQAEAVTDYLQSNSYMKLYTATNKGENNMSTGIFEYGITCTITTSGDTSCVGNA